MGQKFYASPAHSHNFSNGAIGFRSGGSFDCLGPYAKVSNCPISDTGVRLTCYATGYADTFFSVPACTRYRGHHVSGYFTSVGEGGIEFRALDKHKHLFAEQERCEPS